MAMTPAPPSSTTGGWNSSGDNQTTPSGGKIALGWVVGEKPASSYFNWFMAVVDTWVTWLSQLAGGAVVWAYPHNFTAGASGEAAAAGDYGLQGTNTSGGSTGCGVSAIGNAGNGVLATSTGALAAVSGASSGSGSGVGGSASGSGVAVKGVSTGSGAGVLGTGPTGVEGSSSVGTTGGVGVLATVLNTTDATAISLEAVAYDGQAIVASNNSSSEPTATLQQSGSGECLVAESEAGSALVGSNAGSSATVAGANTGSGAAISGNTATGSGPAIVAVGNTSRASLNIGAYATLPAAMGTVAGDMAFTTDGHAHVCFTSGTWTTIF